MAVPESLITGYIQRSIEGRGIHIELTGLKKGLFYTLHVERVTIKKHTEHRNPQSPGDNRQGTASSPAGGENGNWFPLLVVQHLDINPDLLSFLKLSARFNFSGQISQGMIHGTVTRERGGTAVHIDGENINISALPILAGLGIYGDGILVFNLQWEDPRGAITFSVDHAKLTGLLPGIDAVPMSLFHKVKGLLTLEDTVTVNTLTLEGAGLYVRVRGDIKDSNFNGRTEIMVDSSFEQYFLLQAIMERYKVSPGYYVVPSHIDFAPNREQ